MILKDLFGFKEADQTEENLLHILSVMDGNKEEILKKAVEILSYCKKRFDNHTPFLKTYYFGSINKNNWDNYDLKLGYDKENNPIINILVWKPDDDCSYFEYELFGLIPAEVLVSKDWKKLCKEEYLKIENEYEIKKIEQEKLSKIQKEKEELEKFLELKKKYGKEDKQLPKK